MKTIVILFDSLNRHMLSCYRDTWVKTPNIDRLAQRSVRFDNHWLGSAPCMPARRDMLTGRLHFLERRWGGIEPFDTTLPELLAASDVHSHMETDHYHYWMGGGEFYHTLFSSFQTYRGQENDTLPSSIAPIHEPEHLGNWTIQYDRNRKRFAEPGDFATPKTLTGARDWLQSNEQADDFLLWVECFDPHEPFDVPRKYLDMYNDSWEGPRYDWSGYEPVDPESEATAHLRKQYAATLSMADEYLGKLLDEFDRQSIWDDTLIIFTTDHGHLLGEHGATGKNHWHSWNEISHIPLLIHLPGDVCSGETRLHLTQNVDLFPTILERHGAPTGSIRIHGKSLIGPARGTVEATGFRDEVIYGWYGHTVSVNDGTCTYFRAPQSAENQPLCQYFLMPTKYHKRFSSEDFTNVELGTFLPYVDQPVLRAHKPEPIRQDSELLETRLYDISNDYEQRNDLSGTKLEADYIRRLIRAMKAHDSPPEQFERLGLAVEEQGRDRPMSPTELRRGRRPP